MVTRVATLTIRKTAVLQLMIANVIIFILQSFMPLFTETFVLNSANAFAQPWTLVSAMFLHGSFSHLLFNMYALLIFGPLIERSIGTKRFWLLYFGAGILASLGFVIYRELILGMSSSALGASGAVMGILGMVIMLFPKMKVLFFFFVPMSMRTAGILFAAIDLFGAFNPASNIAHVAHLAGLVVGLIYGWQLLKKGKQFKRKFGARTSSFTEAGAAPKARASTRTGQQKYEDTIELSKDDLDKYYKFGKF